MDRIRDIEVFLAIVATQSLVAAGRRLSMSAPAVTRALARLEDRLGTTLVLRTTRSLSLTPAGEAFAQRAKDVIEALEGAEAAVSGSNTLKGTLTVTAPRQLGRIVVSKIVARFLAQHPQVQVRLRLLDRVAHLLDEGIDLGVRIGHLQDSSAIALRLGEVKQLVVGSPDYLAANGWPASPADLKAHKLIAFTGHLHQERLRLREGSVLYAPYRIEVDSAATALELAEAGEGLTPLWSYQAAASVQARRLCPVLLDHMPVNSPCHFIWPERRFENPLVRAFVDFAAPFVSADLQRALTTLETVMPHEQG
ncbi:MAG: LysR family transcriptional regulator [Pseudomonadota bacterium]